MMKEKLYANVKRLAAIAVCAAMLTMTMGLSVFAATTGKVTGSLNNSIAKATLTNKSSGTRYCQILLQESNNQTTGYETIKSNSGVIATNNKISASGEINKLHARGYGEIYLSTSPSAGVAWSQISSIK